MFIALIAILNNLPAATWYVAPNGNDNNLGSLGSPFKTIITALAKFRESMDVGSVKIQKRF